MNRMVLEQFRTGLFLIGAIELLPYGDVVEPISNSSPPIHKDFLAFWIVAWLHYVSLQLDFGSCFDVGFDAPEYPNTYAE